VELEIGSPNGPFGAPVFVGQNIGGNTFKLTVSFTQSSFTGIDQVVNVVGFNGRYLGASGQVNQFFNSNGSPLGTLSYSVRYQTFDGSPDNCGSVPIPAGQAERGFPVNRPVPIPIPLPPIVLPPKPVPVPIPPAPPPTAPRPPRPIRPPNDINLDIEVNFDLSTTNYNLNINCETGTGVLPTAPFQALARLIYSVLFEVKDLRAVVDRMAGQLDCIHEKLCRESKAIYRITLGNVGYGQRSLHGFATNPSERLTPVAIQMILPEISNAAGRRVRSFAPNLFSPQALGYYAFQFESGAFGDMGEVRFRQFYVSIPERAVAIAIWLEPQAGIGAIYCWYERTDYQSP